MFGEMDLVLIGGVVLLLFGPSKLPELMKGMGKGIREFKKAQSDIEAEINKIVHTPAALDKPVNSPASLHEPEVSGINKS
ncbi:MAG: twin-arginine translocase TatA/TatE family subunit [Chlorobiaceae bacterium]|nr:twin-arginine translocase TatA/TatE family subunit [Chlorobiaceae bacterium]